MKNKRLTYYLIIFLSVLSQVIYAQEYTESELKAAYLYNFTKFVEWPSHHDHAPSGVFEIDVFRNKKIATVLREMVKGKKVKNRNIKVVYIEQIDQINTSCQMLLIDNVNNDELLTILKKTKEHPILTVGNKLNLFCQQGGVLNFTSREASYRFEINKHVADWNGLKINMKLLLLSKIITTNDAEF